MTIHAVPRHQGPARKPAPGRGRARRGRRRLLRPAVGRRAPSGALTYRGVGRGDDLFLAHEIRGAPSFDHVLRFRFEDPDLAELQLTGAPVVVHDRLDALDERLAADESVTASLPQTVGPAGQHGFSTQIRILDEVYLEVGELKG